MKIPKRYEDLTVQQFQELEALKSNTDLDTLDKAVKRLSILSGKDVEYIESLTATEIFNTLSDAVFLMSPIHEMPIPNHIVLDKVRFRYIKEIHEYNICQEKDWKEMVKMNDNDYIKCLPELMAICHQEYENKQWVYNSNNHQRNVELFKQSKLGESLGAVFFYSKSLTSYTKVLADYSKKAENQITEHYQMMMEDQEFQTFLNVGDGNTALV